MVEADIDERAIVLSANDGIAAGETGAAPTAAPLALRDDDEVREQLGMRGDSRVLLVCTEGATDPLNYKRVVGRDATTVDPLALSR